MIAWLIALLLVVPTFAHAATSGTVVFRDLCTQIIDPVTNKVGCWEQTSPPTLKYWNGATWIALTGPTAAVTSLTGTTNQITVSAPVGAVTLSLPTTLIAPGTVQGEIRDKGGAIYNVEAYGLVSGGTAGANTAAFNALLAIVAAGGGGVIYFPPGNWSLNPVTITSSNTLIQCSNPLASVVTFVPTAPGQALFTFDQGSASIARVGIQGCGIQSANTTDMKIGIDIVSATHWIVDDVDIRSWTDSGNAGIGLRTRGHEMGEGTRLFISTHNPIWLGINPYGPSVGEIDADHFHFSGLTLTADGGANVTIESGVNLTNVTFDGYQSWNLGTGCLRWVDTATSGVSVGLVLRNVRCEQPEVGATWAIQIEHNTNLDTLIVENFLASGYTDGIKLRKVRYARLDSLYLFASVSMVDVDSTVQPLTICLPHAGAASTITATGLTKMYDSGLTTGGAPFASHCLYYGVPAAAASIGNTQGLTVAGAIAASTALANQFISITSSANSDIFGLRVNGTGTGGRDWRVEQGRSAAGQLDLSDCSAGCAPRLTITSAGAVSAPTSFSSPTLTSTVATGTAPLTVASTTLVANLYVARAALADTTTTNANLTGPITSVGNATSIASQTGTGTKFVVDTSPTLVTPVLGVATATSINKVAITAPATSATLTIADGKTLTASNSLTLAGTDATTITFQGTDTYVGRATTDTLTNKTFDTAGAGNVFRINGTGITTVTGSGSAVLATSPTLVTPVLGTATGTKIALTAGNTLDTVSAFSGDAAQYAAFRIGRTAADGYLGVAGAATNFVADSAQGDVVLVSLNGNLRLGGAGTGANAALAVTTTGSVRLTAFVFANIGTVFTANGDFGYCSDCAAGVTGVPAACAGAGTGAFAMRLNGANRCWN